MNEGSGADPQPVSRQARPLFSCDRVGGPAERDAGADGVDITRGGRGGGGGGCVPAADLGLFRELAPFPSPTCCLPSALRLRVEKGYPGRSRGAETGCELLEDVVIVAEGPERPWSGRAVTE